MLTLAPLDGAGLDETAHLMTREHDRFDGSVALRHRPRRIRIGSTRDLDGSDVDLLTVEFTGLDFEPIGYRVRRSIKAAVRR